jgi:hypothetical protein
MAHAGGMKGLSKRSAFGDVSNTANVIRPSRDDFAIPSKSKNESDENALLPQGKRPLLRPAQRPLSVSGLKGLLSNVTQSSTATCRQPLEGTQPTTQTANTRKILAKRSTTIFKDSNLPQPIPASSNLQGPLPTVAATIAPAAPVHRELNSRQQSLPGLLAEPEPKLRRAQSAYTAPICRPEVDLLPSCGPTSSELDEVLRSEEAYHAENVQAGQYTREREQLDAKSGASDVGVLLPLNVEPEFHDAHFDQWEEAGVEAAHQEVILKHTQAAVSEPEEYWDDEDEDENYDEEGYVTARSFKSRGDNTTGGATTVLVPKMNPKVKKELLAAKGFIESSRTLEEIEDEAWDMSMVAEYGDEIFDYMRDLEVSICHTLTCRFAKRSQQIKMQPSAHYMDFQTEIQWSMRSVLMDWLVQVHCRFGLLPETLFLCVNFIDRFLTCKVVSLGKLQLVGATAIFVAAKYEEINCPSVQEIVYMVDGGYSVDEILKAERFMLSMLSFELGWPGPMSFLRRISKADDYDLETRTLAKYFLELTIMDERFLGSTPSFLAAGAHCLSRMMLKKGCWVSEMRTARDGC